MPHIIAEYSSNLETEIDVPAMLNDMHAALSEGLGGVERIKTRGIRLDHAVVGDQGAAGRMIHITLLLLEGRDLETKTTYSTAIHNAAKKHTANLNDTCAITLEVRDMVKDTYIL